MFTMLLHVVPVLEATFSNFLTASKKKMPGGKKWSDALIVTNVPVLVPLAKNRTVFMKLKEASTRILYTVCTERKTQDWDVSNHFRHLLQARKNSSPHPSPVEDRDCHCALIFIPNKNHQHYPSRNYDDTKTIWKMRQTVIFMKLMGSDPAGVENYVSSIWPNWALSFHSGRSEISSRPLAELQLSSVSCSRTLQQGWSFNVEHLVQRSRCHNSTPI